MVRVCGARVRGGRRKAGIIAEAPDRRTDERTPTPRPLRHRVGPTMREHRRRLVGAHVNVIVVAVDGGARGHIDVVVDADADVAVVEAVVDGYGRRYQHIVELLIAAYVGHGCRFIETRGFYVRRRWYGCV